ARARRWRRVRLAAAHPLARLDAGRRPVDELRRGARTVKRWLLLCALARCACDPILDPDAGSFFCRTDLDCAEGYACVASVCAMPGTGGGPGGGAGGGGGGGGGALFSGGLAFVTPSRSEVTGTCSQPLTFQLLDDAGITQLAPFDLSVQVSAAPSLSFF